MDKVTLDGKVYERSAIVAKRYGYTADYLGQLSRADKVEAQLVGRSWYVRAPSVEEYQAGLEEEEEAVSTGKSASATASDKQPTKPKAAKSRSGEVVVVSDNRSYPVETHSGTAEKSFISKVSRPDDDSDTTVETRSVPVQEAVPEAVTKSAPQRRARSRFSPAEPVQTASHWQKVAYASDDGDLVPDVNKPCVVPPVYELGKKVHVHSNTDKFSIVASAMPEVPLRGQVSVQGVDEGNDDAVSFNYETAGNRVQQQLTELEPPHHRGHSHTSKKASTESFSEPTTEDTEPRRSRSTAGQTSRWTTRLAWGATLLLLVVALAGLFLAQETTYGTASGSPFGIAFAPADWFYRWWPF